MDNAAFNAVSRCLLVGNHGGAVKFVRACAGNRVEANAGWSNSAGNDGRTRFPRYADAGAFDALGEFGGLALCDLGPSRGNTIRRNLIAPAPSAVVRAVRARRT